jgi:hypothetical protein
MLIENEMEVQLQMMRTSGLGRRKPWTVTKHSMDNLKKIITYLSHVQSIDLLSENLEHDDCNRPFKGHTEG